MNKINKMFEKKNISLNDTRIIFNDIIEKSINEIKIISECEEDLEK
jgi:hypothetical protein